MEKAGPAGNVIGALVPSLGSPGRLPLPFTSFLARETEIAEATALLRRHDVRLLTLTGPGGVGKTRLAIAVAHELAAAVPDGCAFVALAPVHDPALVAPTIAQALGMRDATDEPLIQRLSWVLRDKALLLVLDNFEHLIEAAPVVSQLLAACPALVVLATSRQRLNLSVEHELVVPPLAIVELATPQDRDHHNLSAAVRLFVDRAQAVKPDFAVTEANAATVAAICHRLDGLPLAIELAAARVKVLPPVALLTRLEQRLPLLTGGARDMPERQRTMRDTIAWSYDLLPPEEQRLLQRLAVFAGGFSLAAIEAVAGGLEASGLDALEGVTSLIDKSLLQHHETPDGEPRFTMLETIREFGLEQLMAAGEERAIRERHARWCLNLAEELEPFLFSGRDDTPYLARLDAELDNVRAAIGWFSASLQHAEMLRLIVAIRHYLGVRPYPAEVLRWLEVGLRQGADVSVHCRALALCLAIYMSYDLDDVPAVTAYAEEAIALAPKIGDPLIRGQVHYCAGVTWTVAGDLARAARDFDEALAQFRTADAPLWIATTLEEVGDLRLAVDDVTSAIPILDEALAIHRQLGPSWSFAGALGDRAHAALQMDDPVLAAKLLHEGIAMASDMADLRTLMGLVASLAGVALALGQPKRGVRLLGAIEMAQASSGIRRTTQAPYIERIRREAREWLAEPGFTAAWEEGRSFSFAEAVTDAVAFCVSVLEPFPVPQDPANPFGLTPRETDVLRLLVAGRSNREIAGTLFIGARTVQTHVANLFAKLGVNARAEAAAVAVRQGIV